MQGKGALRRQGLGPQEGARPGEPAWAWAWAWGGGKGSPILSGQEWPGSGALRPLRRRSSWGR